MDRTAVTPRPVDSATGQVPPQARDAVNRLIDIVATGIEGHRRSAELVEEPVARSLFQLWSRERTRFLTTYRRWRIPSESQRTTRYHCRNSPSRMDVGRQRRHRR